MKTTRPTRTIRIPEDVHTQLQGMARMNGVSVGATVEAIVAETRRTRRLREMARAGAELRASPEKWAAYQREIDELDGTVGDGLSNDPWFED